MRSGSERIALGVGEHLAGRDREHHRLTAAVGTTKTAITNGELPPPVPFVSECAGDLSENAVIAHLRRVAFNNDIQARVPPIAASNEHHVRVGTQVGELLLSGARGKPDRVLGPRSDNRRRVRATVGSNGANPEEFGGLEDPAGLLPFDGDCCRIAVLVVKRGDGFGHRDPPVTVFIMTFEGRR